VHPSLPATSVKALIALARSRPGQIQFASGGAGTDTHLAGEMLKTMAGIDLRHVPYKGIGPAVIDVVGGHVPMILGAPPGLIPHGKSGKLRLLAVTSAKRAAALPELPTIAESALPDYEVSGWYGVLAPAATPPETVSLLNAAIVKVLFLPDVRSQLATMGLEVSTGTPAEFGAYIKSEIAKWAKVVRESGARAD